MAMTGPALVEATRTLRGSPESLVEKIKESHRAGMLEDVHISAILGTALEVLHDGMSVVGNSIKYMRFRQEVLGATGYQGFSFEAPSSDSSSPSSSSLDPTSVLLALKVNSSFDLDPKSLNDRDMVLATRLRDIVRDYLDPASPVSDTHMAALLAVIMMKGMNRKETVALTEAMWKSGETLDFSSLKQEGYIGVDKHSTGGIGDGVSLVLAPLVAAAHPKVYVPMMSGRGLGHTGGTLDKLESIPGFRVNLSPEEIVTLMKQTRAGIFAQAPTLAPADGKLYALRDATNCVANDGLIVGSILSKKLAEGTDVLMMDTKTGAGAFLSEYETAKRFAQTMCDVGAANGLRTNAFITDMNQPLGRYAGNKLEVIEALEHLLGHRQNSRFMQVTYCLAQEMLYLADPTFSSAALPSVILEDHAFEKFAEMVQAQGGTEDYVSRLRAEIVTGGSLYDQLWERSLSWQETFLKRILKPEGGLKVYPVVAEKAGFIGGMRLTEMGEAIRALGAGRYKPTDTVNPDVGVIYFVELGDRVGRGQTLALVLHDGKNGEPESFGEYFTLETEVVAPPKLIKEMIVLAR